MSPWVVEAGVCLVEFDGSISDRLGRLARNAFFLETWVDHSIFTSLWGVMAEAVVYS